MTGINFVDTIVVRRTMDKGTKIVEEPIGRSNWAGKEFVKYSLKKMSSVSPEAKISVHRGTSSIKASEYPKHSRVIPESGIMISTGKGTGVAYL